MIWVELDRVKEQAQRVPQLYELFETIRQAQVSNEKHLAALRKFAKHVEQHLEQIAKGALPPKATHQSVVNVSDQGVSQAYVPGTSASSSAAPVASIQIPTPPTVTPPPISLFDLSLSSPTKFEQTACPP